jgi:hypothetical protein
VTVRLFVTVTDKPLRLQSPELTMTNLPYTTRQDDLPSAQPMINSANLSPHSHKVKYYDMTIMTAYQMFGQADLIEGQAQ